MIDDLVERLGRRLAARTTRRTFLGRAAQVGVVVAGGTALATLLTERAEARVCGQSGVSPTCPTYDCPGLGADSVWGWCWYASPGCCAGGGLKKICDCCTTGWPNVHGYCPSGTNVRCIVESCFADPRVMYVPLLRAPGLTGPSVAAARSRLHPDDRGGAVVLGEADDAVAGAVAGAAAGALGVPLLLTARARLSAAVLAELQRRAAGTVYVFDSIAGPVDAELRSYGLKVERFGAGPDLGFRSLDAIRWLGGKVELGAEAVCVAASGLSASVASGAAALAGNQKLPLVVGVDAARTLARPATWLLGPEPSAEASTIPGARPVGGDTREALSVAVASLVIDHYLARDVTLHLVPAGAPDIAPGLAGGAGVVLVHPPGVLGGDLYGWVNHRRAAVGRAVLGGTSGQLGDQGIYDLQGALHHFDPHRLVGTSGQGLPVLSQPGAEREIGRARVEGDVPAQEPPYWADRARVRKDLSR
jgi:hypothetical protein